jgi:hypothetical protein
MCPIMPVPRQASFIPREKETSQTQAFYALWLNTLVLYHRLLRIMLVALVK